MNNKTDATAAEQVPEQAARADEEATVAALAPADETAAPDAGAEPDAVQSIPDPKPGGRWFVTLLLLCLTVATIGAIGAGGYFIHDLNDSRASDRAARAALAQQLEALQQSHTALAETLRQLEGRQRQTDEQLSAAVQHLRALRRQVNHASGWQLEELRFLLHTASQRLALGGDVNTALAALRAADVLLREIPDSALIPVRERLIRAINRLHAHPRPDFSGVALALADLAARAQQLPLNTGASEPQPAPPQPDPQPRWRQLAGNIWQELKSLIVITRDSGQSAALLAPSERFFLHRNLRLQLEAARLALLARDQSQYRASIEAATDWLREFFEPDDAGVRSALEILQDAAALELNRPRPSLEATLSAFDEYLLRQDGL